MTLSEFETILKIATPSVFEREAPHGVTRYIVWHAYNLDLVRGDDHVCADFPRVQLDVFWQRRNDSLLDDLRRILDYFRLSYDLQDLIWDDDRHLRRAILQLTVA